MEEALFKDVCRKQYRAMFKMLREAVKNCPRPIWAQGADEPPFWQQAYHTLECTDYYLGDSADDFEPPSGFSQDASDLARTPRKAPTKKRLLEHLEKVSRKCVARLRKLDAAALEGKNPFHWTGPTLAHHMVYNLRHAQHHVGVMNSILRRKGAKPAKWICTP